MLQSIPYLDQNILSSLEFQGRDLICIVVDEGSISSSSFIWVQYPQALLYAYLHTV